MVRQNVNLAGCSDTTSYIQIKMEKRMDSDKTTDFSCLHYEAEAGGGRRCRNYLDGGGCELESYVMCVEWLRVNPSEFGVHDSPAGTSIEGRVSIASPPVGDAPAGGESLGVGAAGGEGGRERDMSEVGLALVTEESLAALAATGAEVDLKLGDGALLTLVPDYTHGDRSEITYRDCATIVECIRVFPGAKFRSFRSKGGA